MNAEAAAFIVAALVVAAAYFIGWGGLVYHRWLAGSAAPFERARRRLYWQTIRRGTVLDWAIPAAVPLGLSLLLMAVGVWVMSVDEQADGGSAIAVLGLLCALLSLLVAARRPAWLLARWHRVEIQRASEGLGPVIPAPDEKAVPRPMTPRERLIGLLVALALAIAWWALSLPLVVLLLAGAILWIVATTPMSEA